MRLSRENLRIYSAELKQYMTDTFSGRILHFMMLFALTRVWVFESIKFGRVKTLILLFPTTIRAFPSGCGITKEIEEVEQTF